jgi:ribulose-phosphate 3-epimerase
MMPRISPSILSADFANLQAELESISSADMVHVDVMDGHFVPNLTIGLPVVRRISEVTALPLDVHLMIENPDLWAPKYAEFSQSVTFHFEAVADAKATIAAIREAGAEVAMAIKPNTQFEDVAHLCPMLDMLLVMTVEPGFGGQSLIEASLDKVAKARAFADGESLALSIQVDGGVTVSNIPLIAKAGADTFVAGTAVFGATNRNTRIEELRALAITL